jgi:hypothetical protein
MSAKLEKALANKQVLIRKLVSGEVVLHFKSNEVKDLYLSHNGVIDLLSKRGVTIENIRNSNLKELLQKRYVDVL